MGGAPRAYDKALAARLQDLADSVADECDRAKAAEIAAQRDRELRAARKVMSAFVASVPIESVMTDRDLRVLAATPRWLEAFASPRRRRVGRTLPEISPVAFAYFEGPLRAVPGRRGGQGSPGPGDAVRRQARSG